MGAMRREKSELSTGLNFTNEAFLKSIIFISPFYSLGFSFPQPLRIIPYGGAMSTYVIADPHLSEGVGKSKSMEVFGRRWTGYTEKLINTESDGIFAKHFLQQKHTATPTDVGVHTHARL